MSRHPLSPNDLGPSVSGARVPIEAMTASPLPDYSRKGNLLVGTVPDLVVDGRTITNGERVILRLEHAADPLDGGVYTRTEPTKTIAGAPWQLTRSTDAHRPDVARAGALFFVRSGATHRGTLWALRLLAPGDAGNDEGQPNGEAWVERFLFDAIATGAALPTPATDGEMLVAIGGAFVPAVPLVSENGWLINDAGELLVVG